MDYKGYNIAVHEMGHNVEQTISLREADHTLLSGVPNTAFTEALAFVFQARDLELLGLSSPSEESRALQVLDDFWSAAEISSVAPVDMGVWHWMYDHPEATPAALREATMAIARDVWNTYWAPVIGRKDSLLLGIYSHMVARNLYLPDYPIGALISIQLEEQMARAGDLGTEFTRMASYGRVVPDLWMENATGSVVSAEPLLAATRHSLELIATP
jgi:oligoendopeptidase F